MKLFVNKDIRHLFCAMAVILTALLFLTQLMIRWLYGSFSLPLLVILAAASGGLFGVCFLYFARQNRIMEAAVKQINSFLDGDTDARIACDEEGEMYRLFHSVNTLAAVLNAHAVNQLQSKEALKNTISDISHQLKTPLAALNIYNGLLQEEGEEQPAVREFAALSEAELDRIETLVQNLLKIAKLDSGSVVFEKTMENVAELMKDVELHFAPLAAKGHKEIVLSGGDKVFLCCDRSWMLEAVGNIVKNALDHTREGDTVRIEWKNFGSIVQIVVRDNGCGIHPEDLNHIFKRFYRSRFSKDTQGTGLGLPLAKTVIEAHNGTIEVDSKPGRGTAFVINFLIPTKL